MKKANPKPLIINKITYAHYDIQGDFLFLKLRKSIGSYSVGKSEDFFALLISIIEDKEFSGIGYLNIK